MPLNNDEVIYAPLENYGSSDSLWENNTDTNILGDNESLGGGETSDTAPIIPEVRRKPKLIMEPAMFSIMFASGLVEVIFQNQLLYQSCTVVFHHNRSECEPLLGIIKETNASKEIEEVVQPYVANMLMASSLINSIFPAIISLFIGPWSDKFGRRFIMLTIIIAFFCTYVIIAIMTGFSLKYDFNPWFYLFCFLPTTLTGGLCALIIVTNCYITDIAPENLKGLCLVLNDAAIGLGMFLGYLTGGYLFAVTNMAIMFCISGLALIPAFLYVLCFTQEIIPHVDIPFKSKIREFFQFHLVMDLMRTCFLRPRGYERTSLWLTMLSVVLFTFAMLGTSRVFYLFVRKSFKVTVAQFTTYSATASAYHMCGGIIGIIVLKEFLNFSNITIALLGLAGYVLDSIIVTAAGEFWELYLAAAVNMFGAFVISMLLAIVADMTTPHEISKIYSLITSAQTVTPLAATPLYTTVYNATITYYPGMFNIISIVLYLLAFTLIAIVYGLRRANKVSTSQ